MEYSNPPVHTPENVYHKTFYSELAGHEVGYNIYLPPEYMADSKCYPIVYHIHGWMNHESTEIGPMEPVYRARSAITVFPNISLPVEDPEHFPIEEMLLQELIPHIEKEYRADTRRENRSLSGFSMGGGLAFYYAVKHPELFSTVTAYAGTYHHYFNQGFVTVGADPKIAGEFREMILNADNPSPRNILQLLNRQADSIRDALAITLHVGTQDILHCDNEILHLHLNSLQIPHSYKKFEGAAHELEKIV